MKTPLSSRYANVTLEDKLNKLKKKQASPNSVLVIPEGKYIGGYVKYQNQNFRHGSGEFLYTDGSHYKGQFSCDCRHGDGCFICPNMNVYKGEWCYNFPHGKGKYYLASHKRLFEEFWVNGVAIRIANNFSFDTPPPTSSPSISREPLRVWNKIVGKYEKPQYEVYTVSYFSSIMEKLSENEESIHALVEYCEKWDLHLDQAEVVVALLDTEEGCFLSVPLAVQKTCFLEKMIFRFWQCSDEDLLMRVFGIGLVGSVQHHTELIRLVEQVPENGKNPKMANWISRILSAVKYSIAAEIPVVRSSVAILEERTRAYLERSDLEQQIPELIIRPLLTLYGIISKFYKYDEKVKSLQIIRSQVLNEVGDPQSACYLGDLADFVGKFLGKAMGNFLTEQRRLLEEISNNSAFTVMKKQSEINRIQSEIQKWNETQCGNIGIQFSTSISGNPPNPSPAALGISETLFSTFERIWDWASPDYQPEPPRFRPKGSKQFRQSVLYGMDISRPLGLIRSHTATQPRLGTYFSDSHSDSEQLSLGPSIPFSGSPTTQNTILSQMSSSDTITTATSSTPGQSSSPQGTQLNLTGILTGISGTQTSTLASTLASKLAGAVESTLAGTLAGLPPAPSLAVSMFSNTNKPPIPPETTLYSINTPCFLSIASPVSPVLLEGGIQLVGALVRNSQVELIDIATSLMEQEDLDSSLYLQDPVILKGIITMVHSFLALDSSHYEIVSSSNNPIEKLKGASLFLLAKFASNDISDLTKELIVSLGLDQLYDHLSSQYAFLQTDVLELIAVLASGADGIRETIVQMFLPHVIEKLKSGKTDLVRAAAARAVANLCYNEKYKKEVVSQGALSSLLEFTKQGQVQINNAIKQEELKVGPLLGVGTFARVYKGSYKNHDVAIKVFSESSLAFRLEDFYKEVAIMCILSHENIVGFEGACIERKRDDESVFMIVTELMEKGSLKDLIKENPLSTEQTVKYAIHIANAMVYIHQVDIIHRDLKCDNVLLNKDDVAKVADLGLAREIDIDNGMTLLAGTPKWEAPEVLVSKKGKRNYSKGVDVYSFGMVLYEMLTGLEPFADIHDLFELKKVVCDKHKRPKVPKKTPPVSPALLSLMKACWHRDPSRRPSFEQVRQELPKIVGHK